MPHDYQFPISFRRRYNLDEPRVFARERQWCERYELSEEEAGQVLAAHPGRIAAYSLPDASPAGLDLMTDVNCWFWYVDNLFDGPLFDRPAAATRLVEQMAEVVTGLTSTDLSATATRALAAHWHSACEGMSWHWRARAAHNWATYLWANVTEAADRAGDTGPKTLEAYMSVRRYSIGVAPSLDLIEPTCGFEMPDSAYYRPEIRWLRTLAADVILLCNDVVSLEKEEARGETFNAVTLLQQQAGRSRDTALAEVVSLIKQRAEAFHTTEARVPAMCDALELSPRDRESTLQAASAIHAWIGGFLDWQPCAPRYGAPPSSGLAAA